MKHGQTVNEILSSYNGGDIVPIYTPEQLTKVGTGEEGYVAETGKVYTFTDDKTYMFYGESEDITNVINKIVDERVSEIVQKQEENEKRGKCLAWAKASRSSDGIWTIDDGYNISQIVESSTGDIIERVYFTEELNNNTYSAHVSAECDGIAQEIVGVYNYYMNSFTFDVSSYLGNQEEPILEVSIFVWGNE